MPTKPKSVCSHPGCYVLTDEGKCAKHKHRSRKELDSKRGTAHERGYGYAWQKASKNYLASHPFCEMKLTHDGYKPATVVDHKTPHRGDMQLFWDVNNWQSGCKACHDYKTYVLGR